MRQLERLLEGYVGQEELMVRLHAEEEEIAARVAGVEALKHNVCVYAAVYVCV